VVQYDKVIEYKEGYFIGENVGKLKITELEGKKAIFTYTL
jgi:hypothetical protein